MLKKFFRPIADPPANTSGLLVQRYQQRVEQQLIQYDEAQFIAIQQLQRLLDELSRHRKTLLTRFAPIKTCQSLYIFGEVGRGKSMLMDLFYQACPLTQKRRVFFHSFMLEIHAFIHQWQQQKQIDAIPTLADKIRASTVLLCFDEFHVMDIADAMILQRLFSRLFELGTIIVITSNRHPNDLYRGGLQKDQFLVFSRLLQAKTNIIELRAKTDYRLSFQASTKTNYHFPLGSTADNFIQQHYHALTQGAVKQAGVLRLLGRTVYLSATHNDIVLVSFAELCVQPLGSADYLQLAKRFSIVLLTDIPKLSFEHCNEAKRFITLIDTLYEHKIQLICTAEAPIQALYTEGEGSFEFKRTVSRLIEMQSAHYQHSAKSKTTPTV